MRIVHPIEFWQPTDRRDAMIVMTTMLVISGLLGSAIAIDDLKAANSK